MELTVNDMRGGYVDVVRAVMEHGHVSKPRGMETRELIGVTVNLMNPRDCLPVGVGRKLNPAIAAAEALQLVGGVSDPALMSRITSNFDRFKNGGSFDGAYGPRIRHQLPKVVERLQADPDTRQAVLRIWDDCDLFRDDSLDVPCTLLFQFFIRDGRLIMRTDMRSNDVWWGLAHDIFQFAQLQLAVANVLGLPAGPLIHQVGSLHAYERDFDTIEQLYGPTSTHPPREFTGLIASSVKAAQDDARMLLDGTFAEFKRPIGDELWFVDQLAKYV